MDKTYGSLWMKIAVDLNQKKKDKKKLSTIITQNRRVQ